MSVTIPSIIFRTFAEPRICSLWTFDLSEDEGAVAEGMVGGRLAGTTNENRLSLGFQSMFTLERLRVIDPSFLDGRCGLVVDHREVQC